MEKMSRRTQNSPHSSYCEICCSTDSQTETLPCDHKYCLDCIKIYMESRIHFGACAMYCPRLECNYEFPAYQVMKTLDAKSQQLYLKLTLCTALAQNRETRYCPGTNCDFAVLVDPAFVSTCGPIIQCRNRSCGVEFCYYCKELWHPAHLCARAEANFPGTKRCPRCGIHIMKRNDGSCNQMICTACNHEFCWLCLEKLSSSHFPFSCPAFGRQAYSKKRRFWNRAIFGVTLPITLPITVAIASGVVAINVTFLAAVGSVSSPFILAKRFNNYLKRKKVSDGKRKAAVLGGTGVAVLALPALAPWGIYRTVRWFHGQMFKAFEEMNEFNFEELNDIQTTSDSEASLDESKSLTIKHSWPVLTKQDEPWEKGTPGFPARSDDEAATRNLYVEPSSVDGEKDNTVAMKAAYKGGP